MSLVVAFLFSLVALVGIAWVVIRLLRPAKGKPMVCVTCGHYGPSVQITKGSLGLEIFLWLLFLFPGLIYSIWRLASRKHGCASCGETRLVPPNSPVGRRLLNDSAGARPK